jgi:ribonuclease HI
VTGDSLKGSDTGSRHISTKAEPIVLTHALYLAAKRTVNIYKDSKYAFTTLHVHAAIYKERGLIISGGKDTKYGLEILKLLEAVQAPKKVSVMHCLGHQKGKTPVALGNWKADQDTHAAALWDTPAQPRAVTAALFPTPLTECVLHYSSHDCEWFTQEEGKYYKGG